MHLVFLDFESYYSTDVSLKKMSPGEYVTHPEFEFICCSVRVDRGGQRSTPTCHFGWARITDALIAAECDKALCIAHNMNGFDGLLMAKLGIHPLMFGCTLSMARPVYGHLSALGLGSLVEYLKLGTKSVNTLAMMKGKHLKDFTAEELQQVAYYCNEDTDNSAKLFYHLAPFFRTSELWQIDTTARARIYPELELDTQLLAEALVREKESKRTELLDLADALGIQRMATDDQTFEAVRSRLASAPKMVELLEALGAEVPYKLNGKGELIPALAKTDEGFIELCESEDPLVAQAAQARLSIKSTLLETRIGKMVTARRTSTALPVPLNYAGAKVTDRWSGAEYNMQNLPRINKKFPKNSDALRQSVVAPKGYVIGVADQSGIELRTNHHLWKVERSTAMYRENVKADLYRDFASARWRITPAEVDDKQRQVGKVSHLQLQYGSGAKTFQRTARVQGGIDMTLDEADEIKTEWRHTYWEIPDGWNRCGAALQWMSDGIEETIDPWGLCHTVQDGIMLPTGHVIRYPKLRQVLLKDPLTGEVKLEWVYGVGRFTRRIYGPKVTANLIQALARDIVAEDAVEFFKQTGFRWKAMTHDELIYVWPQHDAQQLLDTLQGQMRKRRSWWPELVLWSEGGLGYRYSEAH